MLGGWGDGAGLGGGRGEGKGSQKHTHTHARTHAHTHPRFTASEQLREINFCTQSCEMEKKKKYNKLDSLAIKSGNSTLHSFRLLLLHIQFSKL